MRPADAVMTSPNHGSAIPDLACGPQRTQRVHTSTRRCNIARHAARCGQTRHLERAWHGEDRKRHTCGTIGAGGR